MSESQRHEPPHSDAAEQTVLGMLLTDPAAFDGVADLLTADRFYRPMHRAIYSTIARLAGASRAVDPVSVFDAGGHDLSELTALANGVYSSRGLRTHAETVVRRWVEREAARISRGLADDLSRGADDGKPAAELIDSAVGQLLGLGERSTTDSEPRDIEELAVPFLDDLSERAEGKTDTIATGLADLDRLTGGGGRPGELWVVGARPSMGKTALTLTVSRNAAQHDGVLMLTQEDSLQALMARHVAAAGRVNLADIRNPARAPDAMWGGVAEGIEQLRVLSLAMDDQAGLTTADVRRKVQQTRRAFARRGRQPLKLVIVDYLQLMVGEGANRNIELGRISNDLKRAAKQLGVWIVLLSQMNREADKRAGPPQLSDLRDSGDIEGAADVIGLLHRECRRTPTADKHHAELHVVKHKNGATDTVHLHFDGAFQRFSDWDGPPPRPGKPRAGAASSGGLD